MAKGKTEGGRSGRDTKARRKQKSVSFTIGRKAFGKVSEVEGIHISDRLQSDLRRLEGVSNERRRTELAGKYGKK